MTNMEKIYKPQPNENTWNVIINSNNNQGEDNFKEIKECQAMKPKDAQLVQNREHFSNQENDETSRILTEVMNDGFGKVALRSQNSNCSSANNSTDNLSYLSDSCAIDEVLILQGNISDEEISLNSDDCVYAYRGADFDIPNQRVVPADDETDFLEMDFDPDPASEIDPVNETNSHAISTDTNYKIPAPKSTNTEAFDSETAAGSKQYKNAEGKTDESKNKLQNAIQIEKVPEKLTGAKPKKIATVEKTSKTLKVSKHDELESFDFAIRSSESPIEFKETDEACLDCLEKEFLSKTIGKKLEPFQCSKCKCKFCFDNYSHSTPYKLSNFNNLPLSELDNEYPDMNHQREIFFNPNGEEKLLIATKKETVSFLNIEAEEKTILLALEKIDATFNRDTIRNYFCSTKKSFKDVPDLIVYVSKRNCDYKRIMKLIQHACVTDLELKFTPHHQAVNSNVQVSAYDILQCWSRKSDLGKLKKLGKRFSDMNVLGKVAYLIRQIQQGNTTVLNQVIAIPQYYETGYITINKK